MRVVFSLVLAFTLSIAQTAFAVEVKYEEGKQYQRIAMDVLADKVVSGLIQKSVKENKVQVLEFFSYACHWCYTLDPAMTKWSKSAPAYIDFQRVPVEFQPTWGTLTKAYYTALQMNVADKVHVPLFDAIYNGTISSSSDEVIQKFFEEKGIKADAFTKAYNSTEVANQRKWANSVAKAYRITAIPAVIVQGPNGAYLTSVKLAGGDAEVVAVVDFLVKKQKGSAKKEK